MDPERKPGGPSYSNDPKGTVSSFLSFETFVTPSFIKIIYIIGVVIIALAGLITMFTRDGVLSGLIILILSPFIPRIWAEMLIVRFRTLDLLEEINRKL